jgi:hypothetical protein
MACRAKQKVPSLVEQAETFNDIENVAKAIKSGGKRKRTV